VSTSTSQRTGDPVERVDAGAQPAAKKVASANKSARGARAQRGEGTPSDGVSAGEGTRRRCGERSRQTGARSTGQGEREEVEEAQLRDGVRGRTRGATPTRRSPLGHRGAESSDGPLPVDHFGRDYHPPG
jgi:hypothetical protein